MDGAIAFSTIAILRRSTLPSFFVLFAYLPEPVPEGFAPVQLGHSTRLFLQVLDAPTYCRCCRQQSVNGDGARLRLMYIDVRETVKQWKPKMELVPESVLDAGTRWMSQTLPQN